MFRVFVTIRSALIIFISWKRASSRNQYCNPFESDAEALSSSLKKKAVKKSPGASKVKNVPKPQPSKSKRIELFGSDSESDADTAPGHTSRGPTAKKRKLNIFPDSEDEEPEPIRASTLKNYLTRRTASGYTTQSEPAKRGEYYVEVRISNSRELEAIATDRWQHSLISFKTAVDDKTPTWKAVTQLVAAVKEDFRSTRPVLYPSK